MAVAPSVDVVLPEDVVEPLSPVPASPPPASRRSLLAAGISGLAGLVLGAFGRPTGAEAAAGQPLVMGAANSAGTANTSLAAASSGTALLVTQTGTGTALRGSAVGAGSIAGFFTANSGTGHALVIAPAELWTRHAIELSGVPVTVFGIWRLDDRPRQGGQTSSYRRVDD